MCSPSPPPSPDYRGAAIEQGTANKETAIAQSMLNNPNVVNPLGTQSWSGGEDGSRPTLTQTFSPQEQALYDQSSLTKGLLGGLSIQGARGLEGVVGKNLDFSGMPASPGDSSATRDKVFDSMMSRVNEDYGVKSDDMNSNLIASGLRPGSKAYDDAQFQLTRGQNDARQQAMIASGAEAQRDFGMDTQLRKDSIAEMLAGRQTPLNEITALMSGSQVSNPFAIPGAAQNTQIAPAPLFAGAQAQGQWDQNMFNQQQQSSNAQMSGLMSLGASGIGAYGAMNAAPMVLAGSDRRIKQDIRRIGDHPLGIGIYKFKYIPEYRDTWGHGDRVGVMAQELMEVMPEAVVTMPTGYMAVRYDMIGGVPHG